MSERRTSRPLRIAQVSPLAESVPPLKYGGTERIVHFLTEELVERGHEVTLFASGDSETRARLVAPVDHALRLDPNCADPRVYEAMLVDSVLRRSAEFDIIHNHIDYAFYPAARACRAPVVTTAHGRLDLPDLNALYRYFSDVAVVSISNEQRRPVRAANFVETIYHGIPRDSYGLTRAPGEYLAFVGRVSPEKRVDDAIRVAIGADIPIRIAAKIDAVDREYFHETIAPLFQHPLVEYVGEIGESEKSEFLGNALAMVFMVDWPEPFGLAMIEAMACGTPVIARRCGSIPEVVDEGVTGFVVDSVAEAVARVQTVGELSREGVYARFCERFSVTRMTDDYERLFGRILELQDPPRRVAM